MATHEIKQSDNTADQCPADRAEKPSGDGIAGAAPTERN